MEAWYISSFGDKRALRALLEHKGISYSMPTCLQAVMRSQTLQVRHQDMLRHYAFVKLEIDRDYYQLMHDKNFPGNIYGILRTEQALATVTADEIDIWNEISAALSQPVRLRKGRDEQLIITNKALKNACLVRFYGRKMKATIKIKIGDSVHNISGLPAFVVGDRSRAAVKLAMLYKEKKQLQSSRRKKANQKDFRLFIQKLHTNRPTISIPFPKPTNTVYRLIGSPKLHGIHMTTSKKIPQSSHSPP